MMALFYHLTTLMEISCFVLHNIEMCDTRIFYTSVCHLRLSVTTYSVSAMKSRNLGLFIFILFNFYFVLNHYSTTDICLHIIKKVIFNLQLSKLYKFSFFLSSFKGHVSLITHIFHYLRRSLWRYYGYFALFTLEHLLSDIGQGDLIMIHYK